MLSLLKAVLSHFRKNEFRLAFCTSLRFGPINVVSSALYFDGSPENSDLDWEYRFAGTDTQIIRQMIASFFIIFR
jgi:hypothetical protein